MQAVGIGSPVTSGNNNIEYSIQPTTSLQEKKTQQYYSEKINYINGIFYGEINLAHINIEHSNSLPNGNIYMCHHSHFKIHPEMDDIFLEICNRDKNSVIVLGSLPYFSTLKAIEYRLSEKLGDKYKKHIFILPELNLASLQGILSKSHVMLDTLFFGSGTTAVEATHALLPVVSYPNLRHTYVSKIVEDIYNLLDCQHIKNACIAYNTNDYIEKCVEIATNHELRNFIKKK
ncbi:tetratricopeptide repeat protein [Piscirickettsia litoralis]|uniref:hypothetical protein n=1 Tax=Piscirickettsia litoralis TaxID=1891921 RepID=UPI001112E9F7|nr:hypothetical protein [Piscirickettsia litoralis]